MSMPDAESAGGKSTAWQFLLAQFAQTISDVDMAAAALRVEEQRNAHPDEDTGALVERLIREKCIRTGTVGAVTSGAAIIPGIGTAASLTVGVAADIGATFKLQAELVLEIAAAHDRNLTDEEKRTAVLLITGMSGGVNQALSLAGKRATIKITERYAQKWISHALPVVGVAASAATNALTTYLVGQRADAYFRLGPDAMGDWGEIWRTITGVDERALGSWFAEQASSSWRAVQDRASSTASSLAEAGKMIANVAGNTASRTRDTANTLAGTLSEKSAGAASRARDTAVAASETLGDAAKSTRQAIKQRARGAADAVSGLLKRKAPKQPPDALANQE
jgi:hypothetical protein